MDYKTFMSLQAADRADLKRKHEKELKELKEIHRRQMDELVTTQVDQKRAMDERLREEERNWRDAREAEARRIRAKKRRVDDDDEEDVIVVGVKKGTNEAGRSVCCLSSAASSSLAASRSSGHEPKPLPPIPPSRRLEREYEWKRPVVKRGLPQPRAQLTPDQSKSLTVKMTLNRAKVQEFLKKLRLNRKNKCILKPKKLKVEGENAEVAAASSIVAQTRIGQLSDIDLSDEEKENLSPVVFNEVCCDF